jgi:hypothetical protein
MKHFIVVILQQVFFLSASSFCQAPLSDDQVIAAINHAFAAKRHQIGLTLNDVQTNILSAIVCETCKATGYTIYVYTSERD